jgi:predicted acetyltransferase
MSVEIRPCPPDRFAELLLTSEIGFGEDLPDDQIERVRKLSDPARFVGAVDGARFVGTAGVFGISLSVPGGELAAGGITFVTVLPSHRRRGIMRGMMRSMIDDCHTRNEPLAMLWASEGSIYQRFGFGLGTWSLSLEAETAATRYTSDWPAEGTFRLIPAGEGLDLVAPVYDAVRSRRAGFLSRTPDWWTGQLPKADKDARGGEARRLVVYETDSGVEAYAVYKTKADWNEHGPHSTLTVSEAVGSTARGTREIWRYLLDVDLVRTLKAGRLPSDHPLLSLVAEPRRLCVGIGDGLWVRIVDVGPGLEGRTYGLDGRASGRITLELADEYCPWNAGRWLLEIDDGHASVRRTDADADLALSANELASLFLGGFTATALAASGRVGELRPGSLAVADTLFPTALQPWCPQEF